MANSKQARKRVRQAEKGRQHNASMRSMMRTTIKKVVAAIAEGKKEEATAAYKSMEKVIDRYANRGIVHPNKVARHKSRLSAQIKALA